MMIGHGMADGQRRWGTRILRRAYSASWPVSPGVALVALVSLAYSALVVLGALTLLLPPRLALSVAVPRPGTAHVAWVSPGSASWEAGVRAGAPVLALDGHPPRPTDQGAWRGRRVTVRLPTGITRTIDAAQVRRAHDAWPLLAIS